MIFIIIAVILVIYALITMEYDWLGNSLSGGGILALLVAFCLVATGLVVGYNKAENIDYIASSELGNLQDNSQLHGRFVLGTGTIDEYPAYTYYKKLGENQYQQKKLRDDGGINIVVFEDSDKPRVDTIQSGKEPYWGLFGYWWGYDSTLQIEFHVPKGSVVNNVTLDAKD